MKRHTPTMIRQARRGAMLVVISVVLIILFVAAALSIDIAYVHLVRAELRTVSDAAARAGTEALARTQSEQEAIDTAIRIAQENTAAGTGFQLTPADVEIGSHVVQRNGRFQFVPNGTPRNAVRVNAARTAGSPNGPVALMFGPLFGRTSFEPQQSAIACQLDRDMCLVLDVSGSMRSAGRLNALKNAVSVFLDELDGTQQDEIVSLCIYSSNASKIVPLTTNLDLIDNRVRRLGASGMTAIGRGIQVGQNSLLRDPLGRSFAAKTMIVMTDGNHNRGVSPLTAANNANRAGCVVHTITFSGGANQSLMRQVAARTGGIHLHANSNAQLIEAFRKIALHLPVVLID